MTQSVAELLVDLMCEAKIHNVYGVVGDSANAVADAIRRTDGKLNFIHVRNEEAGAFAAGADAQISGRPTAVLGSSGRAACISSTGSMTATATARRCSRS